MENNLYIEITFLILFGIGIDEIKGRNGSLEDSFKPLQVGITNPTPTQQSGNISPTFPSITITGDVSPPSSSLNDRRRSPPKSSPTFDAAGTGVRRDPISSQSKQNPTIQNIQYATPIVPGQSSSTGYDENGLAFLLSFENISSASFHLEGIQTIPSTQSDTRLGKFSLYNLIRVSFARHKIFLIISILYV